MTLLKKCRLWKTDLHMLGLRFSHLLHIVGRVSIRAVFQQSLPYLPLLLCATLPSNPFHSTL